MLDFKTGEKNHGVHRINRALFDTRNSAFYWLALRHEYYFEQAKNGGKMDELWKELAENGFPGCEHSPEYGGEGAGISELAIVCEELARQGCPLLFLMVTPAICASILTQYGSEEQKRKWLPPDGSGEIKMAFAITEPDAGSNTHNLSTRAERVEGGYRIRGTKYYISGVDESAALLLVARTGEENSRAGEALSLFIVPTDVKGLEASPIAVEMVSSEKQFTLFFDDVIVGEESLVGELGRGCQQVFSGLNPERITGAAVVNGIALYALDKVRDMRVSESSGTCRSEHTRVLLIHSPLPRSMLSWPVS